MKVRRITKLRAETKILEPHSTYDSAEVKGHHEMDEKKKFRDVWRDDRSRRVMNSEGPVMRAKGHSSLFVRLHLNETSCCMLIDTGATVDQKSLAKQELRSLSFIPCFKLFMISKFFDIFDLNTLKRSQNMIKLSHNFTFHNMEVLCVTDPKLVSVTFSSPGT
ncbi:unnamed protein product [Nesidiocoris tenuis]|uniref:Uncharacterized protein n=1 Tax=Nesidiocoris tenuis TaxID=355587 RepID=A0A6H5GUH9_9HEMI|nr:unnamed protein product [Nesidiocoris tenuis]